MHEEEVQGVFRARGEDQLSVGMNFWRENEALLRVKGFHLRLVGTEVVHLRNLDITFGH